MVLTDHKAIISALKTNRGNKTHQSRLTRWADRLLPFDFDVFHISGCKLGIVDYLSHFPTFEAPRPSCFDEQYVVKCISRFFDACDYLDEWAKNCNLSEVSTDIPENSRNYVLSKSINLIESLNFGQPRANCPVRGNTLISSDDFGSLSVEGVVIHDVPARSLCTKPAEGDGNFTSGYNDLLQQSKAFVTSPLEGVLIAGLKSSQSALSSFMLAVVIFSAWITNYLSILFSVWIFSTAVNNCVLLS